MASEGNKIKSCKDAQEAIKRMKRQTARDTIDQQVCIERLEALVVFKDKVINVLANWCDDAIIDSIGAHDIPTIIHGAIIKAKE